MQHIPCHRTCLELHSFAPSDYLIVMLAILKNEGLFLALQQKVLDSFWSEQQTLEEISSSNTGHENAGPLHLVTSSSSECYELYLTLQKLGEPALFQKENFYFTDSMEELQWSLFMDQLFIHYETIMLKKYRENKTKTFKPSAQKYFDSEKF